MTVIKPSPSLLRSRQRFLSMLGRGLSDHYAAVAAEPVPEAFLDLLELADRIPPASKPPG